MSFFVDVLVNIVIELQCGIGYQDCFQCLIIMLCQVLECDVFVLLCYDLWQFILFVIHGLVKDVFGRCFVLEGYLWLEVIVCVGDVVCFFVDSELFDFYDGLIFGQESLKVYVCVGLLLFVG